ncbi:hypothetical protein [Streptomyces sp. CB03238]|uniref:hypothetical protein n=1 Tax=Streptomyces sp. CB03238 TaxID=1907777 RepID=UPI00117E3436|nr:hypothetical protein [Streptomyces sp. CB03238]
MTSTTSPLLGRRRGRALTALLALPAALLLVLTTATSASAHYVYERDMVWSNTDTSNCLWTRSEVSHGGADAGYLKVDGVASLSEPATGACILPWSRPAGNLGAAFQYFKWSGSQWYVCRQEMNGIYTTKNVSSITVSVDFPAPPCAGGYYATKGASAVYYQGTWYGKNVPIWSGQHWIEP